MYIHVQERPTENQTPTHWNLNSRSMASRHVCNRPAVFFRTLHSLRFHSRMEEYGGFSFKKCYYSCVQIFKNCLSPKLRNLNLHILLH